MPKKFQEKKSKMHEKHESQTLRCGKVEIEKKKSR